MPVKVYRPHIEQRAAERGIPLEAIAAVWKHEYGDGWWEANTRHPAYPRARPGLGDMVASGLAAVGITKERAQAVASAVGVKDCGCAKRQAALNKLGEKLSLPPGQS